VARKRTPPAPSAPDRPPVMVGPGGARSLPVDPTGQPVHPLTGEPVHPSAGMGGREIPMPPVSFPAVSVPMPPTRRGRRK
jgi:hypothetical protein